MEAQDAIALFGVLVAMGAVAWQLWALRKEHRLARIRARYEELERLYSDVGHAAGRTIDRMRLWAVTGEVDAAGALLEDNARLRDAVNRARMHQASADVREALQAFAAGHEEMNAVMRKGLTPKKPTGAAFAKLDWLLANFYERAGEHLRGVWPRPSELD